MGFIKSFPCFVDIKKKKRSKGRNLRKRTGSFLDEDLSKKKVHSRRLLFTSRGLGSDGTFFCPCIRFFVAQGVREVWSAVLLPAALFVA